MTDRPMLFSAPMVRALLAGTKTQTRRIVKPEGANHLFQFRGTTAAAGADEPTGNWAWCGSERTVHKHITCPYGVPGDQLYCRETWARDEEDGALFYRADVGTGNGADDWERNRFEGAPGYRWRPSIHMPRWASRILLEVTEVRVERLQGISEADARAEGVTPMTMHGRPGAIATCYGAYRALWEQINGPGSWDANPWVWCVSFKRVEGA